MDTLIKADIFFLVTTIAVIVIGIGISVGVVYMIRILRDMKYISNKIKDESDHIAEDLELLRMRVREEGFRLGHILSFFKAIFKKNKKKKAEK